MGKLMKFEFSKLRKQKSLYICFAIMIGMMLLGFWSTRLFIQMAEENSAMMGIQGAEEVMRGMSPSDAMLDMTSMSLFLMLSGIITVIFTCDDFEQKTIRFLFSRGLSRGRVFFAKYFTVMITTTALYALMQILAVLFSKAFFSDLKGTYDAVFVQRIMIQYVSVMACISLYFMIAILIRKFGAAIAVIIVVPSVVEILFSFLDALIYRMGYEMDHGISDLVVTNYPAKIVEAGQAFRFFILVASVIYIAVSLVIGIGKIHKVEI